MKTYASCVIDLMYTSNTFFLISSYLPILFIIFLYRYESILILLTPKNYINIYKKKNVENLKDRPLHKFKK